MLKTVGDKMLGNTGTTIGLIVAFTVLLALIGTTLACLNTGVRVTYAMAKDKEMPGVLSLLHGKYATPHGGIWVLTAISALLGIYGVKSVNNLTQITLASNTGTFIVYGMTCIMAFVAFASRHDRHFIKHKAIPGIGALMNIAELLGRHLHRSQGGRRLVQERLHRPGRGRGLDACWVSSGRRSTPTSTTPGRSSRNGSDRQEWPSRSRSRSRPPRSPPEQRVPLSPLQARRPGRAIMAGPVVALGPALD